jgi:hypothetical protein
MARDKTDKTDTTPATSATTATRDGTSRAEMEVMAEGHTRDKGWRLPMYAASPPGRLDAHEACISRMDADNDFTFDIGMYRAHVEYARAEADRKNWPEARVHIASADAQLTLIGWILDEDRESGAKRRRNLGDSREAQNKAAKANAKRRREMISAMLPEIRLTGGALDKWIIKQLLNRHDISVSERTIRADLKALRQ